MKNNKGPFFKKTIPFTFKGHNLKFNVSQDLFSSQDIDKGTKRLLRTLLQIDIKKYKKILDLGCGYGPIGISMKTESPESEFHMTDRDALALLYTQQNAFENQVEVKTYASLGYDNIKMCDFDLIISNIPAKVGTNVLKHILLDSEYHLAANGTVAIVVVDAIFEETKSILASNKNIIISLQKSWPGHTVFHYTFERNTERKKHKDSFTTGLYDRNNAPFTFNNKTYEMQTTYNLSEFDTLSYDTKLLLDNIIIVTKSVVNKVILHNTNQGHIAVVLVDLINPKNIILIDRDLQALEVTKRNLVLNGYPLDAIVSFHQVDMQSIIGKNADFVIGILPEKENKEVYEMILTQSTSQLSPQGTIVFASSSTVITQIEKMADTNKSICVVQRKKTKGRSIIIMKRKS